MPEARRDLIFYPTRRDVLLGAAGLFAGPALAADGDTLTLATTRDIQGPLDPAARLGALESNLLRAICPGLIRPDLDGPGFVPALASRIAAIDDRTIGFTLRDDLQFADGFGAVTAADVKFSFERFRQPDASGVLPPYAADWAALDEVVVSDRLTGVIRLRQPAPMLWSTVLPDCSGCIISQRALEQGGYRSDRQPPLVVGAGDWRLVAWQPNLRMVMQHRAGRPGDFTRIVLRPVREPKTAELALRANEVQFTAVPPADLAPLRRPGLEMIDRPANNFVWLGINVEHPPFDDPRVRQAIRAAIDVGLLVTGAWDGAVPRANAAIAPGMAGHWAEAPVRRRDLAAARALLAAAGHGAGLDASLLVLDQPEHQNAGVILQAMLRDAGIRLRLDIRDAGAFWSAGGGAAGEGLQLALQRFGGKPDAGFLLQWFTSAQAGGWNWQRWRDADYDRLVAQAAGTTDETARAALYVAAQRRMDESAAFIALTHEVVACAGRADLRPAVLANGEDWLLDHFARTG